MLPLLYIVRHGQTDWNVEERLQGQADTDINAVGRRQADANGRRMAELIADAAVFDFVASPLRRTRETMERVRAGMGLPRQGYRTDDRLMELHFGDWQGFTYAELEAANPGCTQARSRNKWRFVPPGAQAESYEMLAARVKPWFEGASRPTVCVTHGGVIRSFLFQVGQLSADEAASLSIPQDKVLRFRHGKAEWL
ncbi:histidine phosphatase family protein [Nitratireductor sp. ZSWI3]|uniref:histidine phosphatase family protein n=1 Tax=Nitratireductor sp. ZSWI3 TaxID=2966359 RepID=UPI00214F7413|nr:histidine phosphatase family protein [Nitratireductor sp. ZSWI3]MCR4266727.1 histidine phosphatase family protein [Nitratireductor sp. ZSWI3]